MVPSPPQRREVDMREAFRFPIKNNKLVVKLI
jgi:hypothetical protein